MRVGAVARDGLSDLSLLDLEPNFARGLDAAERDAAADACRVSVVRAERGRLDLANFATGWLLIVDGMIAREARLRSHNLVEVLGVGDAIVVTRSGSVENAPLSVVRPALVANLDQHFLLAAARWPSLLWQLNERLEEQRHRLAQQALLTRLARAEDRLLFLLWHLAEQWGRVCPDGVKLPLALTHDALGRMAGARRPTATLALGRLEAEGAVKRLPDGSWLLSTASGRAVQRAWEAAAAAPLVTTSMQLRQHSEELRESGAALRARFGVVRARLDRQ